MIYLLLNEWTASAQNVTYTTNSTGKLYTVGNWKLNSYVETMKAAGNTLKVKRLGQ